MRINRMARLGAMALGLAVLLLAANPAPGRAQGPGFNPAGVPVGAQAATGSTWNFDGSVPAGNGPWTSVSVTNSSCNQPSMPGTAQAGLIIFTAQLSPTPTALGITAWQGNLSAVQGSSATGHVRIVTPVTNQPLTQVDVTIWGLEQMAQGNNFWVCLQGASSGPLQQTIAANIQYIQRRTFSVPPFGNIGFQISDLISTTGPDGTTFIGLYGFRSPSADGGPQWVFFFNGATFLGEDTAVPSNGLSLAGSPAPSQINVQYANYAPSDPLCCPSLPPVTITYTWNGVRVTPSGTPPGH
ncbi:MAG: LppP/LprE family lipoprotein [Dehalococcoidia bacterium]